MPGHHRGYSTQQTTQQNTQNQDISHLTETREPNKDLKIKHLRQKSVMQHIWHWDQQHYVQCIKFQ